LHIANAGDSRAVLSVKGKVNRLFLLLLLLLWRKTKNNIVVKRLKEYRLIIIVLFPKKTNVLLISERRCCGIKFKVCNLKADYCIVVDKTIFCFLGTLSVTRALGDHDLKKYVIPDPYYQQVTLDKQHKVHMIVRSYINSKQTKFLVNSCW
jgi:hypothetical protein